MSRAKRVFTACGILTAFWWAFMAIWATTLPDPILAQVGAVAGPVGFFMLGLMFAWPVPKGPYVEDYNSVPYDPEAQHRANLNQHYEEQREQARMFYLNGEQTPPTDWFGPR